MKMYLRWTALFVTLGFISSCLRDECTQTKQYVQLNPVYMKAEDFRKDEILTQVQAPLKNPGKIYFYKDYLLVNEKGKGIHFYNMSDLSNPVHEIFYLIPGNFDMAIVDDQLIADNVVDLIKIDISNLENPVLVTRSENYKFVQEYQGQNFLAYYETSNRTEVLDCSQTGLNQNFVNWNGGWWRATDGFLSFNEVFSSADVNSGSNSGAGVAGSTSRFMLAKNMLYTLNDYQLWTWNTSTLESISKVDIGWGVETLFAYQDLLFVGSNSGVFIYDLQNPLSPRQLSSLSHATACDPVVVQNNTAYVTLRTGNACTGNSNQLDVIDISKPANPTLVKTYPMKNPHGLAIQGDRLYICEGTYGFKMLEASDREKIKEKSFAKDIKSSDVIALGNDRVMIVGEDGFYVLLVSEDGRMQELSSIKVDE